MGGTFVLPPFCDTDLSYLGSLTVEGSTRPDVIAAFHRAGCEPVSTFEWWRLGDDCSVELGRSGTATAQFSGSASGVVRVLLRSW